MVAAHSRRAELLQLVVRLARPERRAHAVSQVHDQIDGLCGEMRKDSTERDEVAMNITDDGETHVFSSAFGQIPITRRATGATASVDACRFLERPRNGGIEEEAAEDRVQPFVAMRDDARSSASVTRRRVSARSAPLATARRVSSRIRASMRRMCWR